jgi:hypothetical protein
MIAHGVWRPVASPASLTVRSIISGQGNSKRLWNHPLHQDSVLVLRSCGRAVVVRLGVCVWLRGCALWPVAHRLSIIARDLTLPLSSELERFGRSLVSHAARKCVVLSSHTRYCSVTHHSSRLTTDRH